MKKVSLLKQAVYLHFLCVFTLSLLAAPILTPIVPAEARGLKIVPNPIKRGFQNLVQKGRNVRANHYEKKARKLEGKAEGLKESASLNRGFGRNFKAAGRNLEANASFGAAKSQSAKAAEHTQQAEKLRAKSEALRAGNSTKRPQNQLTPGGTHSGGSKSSGPIILR